MHCLNEFFLSFSGVRNFGKSVFFTTRWINFECTVLTSFFIFSGVRKFGKNFATIAEVIGTKTESHVRSFFVNYRRRYNLDNALKEYEAEHGPSGIETPPAEEGGVSGSGK